MLAETKELFGSNVYFTGTRGTTLFASGTKHNLLAQTETDGICQVLVMSKGATLLHLRGRYLPSWYVAKGFIIYTR